MSFLEILLQEIRVDLLFLLIGPFLLIPYIVAEQIWSVHRRPGWRDYLPNILISTTTYFLALPAGIAAGMFSSSLRKYLPWHPLGFSYSTIGQVPLVGGSLEIIAMTFVPILVHDLWFYWAHRIEHKVPFLWEFHKLHHSDELMNCSTWGRDHFLQAVWIALFPAFTLGLVFNISSVEAGQAALLSNLFLSFLSMFYHSAIRVRIRWLDRVLVTPQVHRIHHSVDPQHHNCNFADALPIFDIIFRTYRRPDVSEFPETGLGPEYPPPASLWRAQAGPAWRGIRTIISPQSRGRRFTDLFDDAGS